MSENVKEKWEHIKNMFPEDFIEEYKEKINIVEKKVEQEQLKKSRTKKYKRLFDQTI